MAFKYYRSEPLTEKEKAYNRRKNGVKQRFASDAPKSLEVKRVRDYLAPVKPSYVPAKPRGSSGCRMSSEVRNALREKGAKRAAFFAEIGVVV